MAAAKSAGKKSGSFSLPTLVNEDTSNPQDLVQRRVSGGGIGDRYRPLWWAFVAISAVYVVCNMAMAVGELDAVGKFTSLNEVNGTTVFTEGRACDGVYFEHDAGGPAMTNAVMGVFFLASALVFLRLFAEAVLNVQMRVVPGPATLMLVGPQDDEAKRAFMTTLYFTMFIGLLIRVCQAGMYVQGPPLCGKATIVSRNDTAGGLLGLPFILAVFVYPLMATGFLLSLVCPSLGSGCKHCLESLAEDNQNTDPDFENCLKGCLACFGVAITSPVIAAYVLLYGVDVPNWDLDFTPRLVWFVALLCVKGFELVLASSLMLYAAAKPDTVY